MKIDFRGEYQTISLISFSITFLFYLSIRDYLQIPALPALIQDFLVSLGFYVIVFRIILFSYNKWLWKFIGYRDINISGYWKFKIQKSTYPKQRTGYAVIRQDMYDISIYGFNAGGGNTKDGVAIWHSSTAYIAYRTLYYDYELTGERPGRASRISKGRATVELIGLPPNLMTGTYYDIPIASTEEVKINNIFGSILFERVKPNELPNAIKAQFFDQLSNELIKEDKIIETEAT
jgi:hypothetical protein